MPPLMRWLLLLACLLPLLRGSEELRRSLPGIMGTRCTLLAQATPAALTAAEAAIRAAEARFSTWIADSPMSRLNAAPAQTTIPVDAPFRQLLELARKLHQTSEGAFDPACRPLIELWRTAASEDRLPDATAIAQARAASALSDFVCDAAGISKIRSSARLDFGGIAKGWAIDAGIRVLKEHGCASGLIDIGGDLRTFGQRSDGSGWRIGIRNPWQAGLYARFTTTETAVCTSGPYLRGQHIAGGERLHHIIDPRSGHPAAGPVSVTVIAPRAALADAWATALSVLGPAGLARLPAGVEALLLSGSGPDQAEIQHSAGFPDLQLE